MTLYSPTTWLTGDLITASLMNNLESQYNTYKDNYGPYKFTAGATNQTVIWADESSISTVSTASFTALLSSIAAAGAGNQFTRINIPTNVQPSVLTVEVIARTCAAGNLDVYLGRAYYNAGSMAYEFSSELSSPGAGGGYRFTSTAFVTRSSATMRVYPGEAILVNYTQSVASNGVIKRIALYGASTTPSTGIAYST